jgi:hypothetical protein
MIFENIKNIEIQNEDSWKKKVFITFDLDWCSDDVLSYTLDIIETNNVKATFFVTHETGLLERMRKNKNIELGIHPNFNPLLNGDFQYGKNVNEVVQFYKKIVPEAISVRNHSLTQSSLILETFVKNNLKYDCNTFIPYSSNIKLQPWVHWNQDLIKVPYFWEDDVHCIYDWDWNMKTYIDFDGLKVFDFHPIHVVLNTEHMDRFEKSREHHAYYNELACHINIQHYGTNDFLRDLIIL